MATKRTSKASKTGTLRKEHKVSLPNTMNTEYFQPGVKVWLENPYDEGTSAYRINHLSNSISTRPMYVPAIITEKLKHDSTVAVLTEWNPRLKVELAIESVWPMNDKGVSVDDMVDYTHLHEPAILSNIQARYNDKQIYTKAGEILIAMNPYQLVLDKQGIAIYDHYYMDLYREGGNVAMLNSMGHLQNRNDRPPHIFETANDAYRRIISDHKSQSIIISGESGAGKTETTKQIMQYVANLSSINSTGQSAPTDIASSRRRSASNRDSANAMNNSLEVPLIEKQLLQSNPILESFGNAKTLRNNNSSRFGKYMRIFFDRAGRIIGGSIKHFLLEKSRVSDQLQGERSYHFFYQLCRGVKGDLRKSLFLDSPESFDFLSKSGSHEITNSCMGGANSSDEADFYAVNEALSVIGLDENRIMQIYKIVSIVLHLGNLEFVEADDSHSLSGMSVSGVISSKKKNLEAVSELLGIDEKIIMESVTTKQTKAGGQVLISKIDKREASGAVSSLAKALYARLFSYIVKAINAGIKKTVTSELRTANDFDTNPKFVFLGLLDIFGFEVFTEGNGFEQLLINYANERLHNLFIKHVFRLEEVKFKQEGIDYSSVSFTDNQTVIDLIAKKPSGIFHQLCDACLFGKMSDETILEKMAQKFAKLKPSKSGINPASLFSLAHIRKRGCFIINHSANDVTYSIEGFSTKNKDFLKPQIQIILSEMSNLSVVKEIFEKDISKSTAATRSTLSGANVMLSLRFEENITKLIGLIEETIPRFVRCIKSNEYKRPFFFDTAKVYNQLQYLGVLDSVRIRHDGYSYQKRYRDFFEHFVIVIPAPKAQREFQLIQPAGADYRALSLKVMDIYWRWGKEYSENKSIFDIKRKPYYIQFGNTKLFMRKELSQALETLREIRLRKIEDAAVKIQASYRMHYISYKLEKVYSCTGKIQAAFRGIHYRKKWMKRKHAILEIQKWMKTILSRRLWVKQKKSVLKLQAYIRRCFGRLRFLRIRRGLRVLHGLSRGFIVRRHVLRMLQAVKIIQFSVRKYLKSMSLHWRKVRAALFVQALWRGMRLRQSREDIVEYLAVKRDDRAKIIAIVKLQGAWKTCLIKRKYRQIVECVSCINRFFQTTRLRRRFMKILSASRLIQRVVRGMITRFRIRKMKTIYEVADELWRLQVLREREALDLL